MNVKSTERNGNETTIVVEIDKELMQQNIPILSIICLIGPMFNSIAHLMQSPSFVVLSPSTFEMKNTAGFLWHLLQSIFLFI